MMETIKYQKSYDYRLLDDDSYIQYTRAFARSKVAQELYDYVSQYSLNSLEKPIFTVAIKEEEVREYYGNGEPYFCIEIRLTRVKYEKVVYTIGGYEDMTFSQLSKTAWDELKRRWAIRIKNYIPLQSARKLMYLLTSK